MGRTARTIAIVGPDGAGKTTQAELLVERLRAAGYDAQYIHALYYLSDCLPFADRLRRHLGPRTTRTQAPGTARPFYLFRRVLFGWFGYWFALLTIAIVSVRFRRRDQIVVLDRYYQQFFYDIYGPNSTYLSRLLPQPWQTIYLDADPPTLQIRMEAADRAADDLYYATVLDLYTDCATDRWQSVPADLPIETLHEQIFETVQLTDPEVSDPRR